MPAFQIDVQTGDLVFPELGARVARLSKWKAFPAALKAHTGPENDVRTGWIWRRLTDLTFQGHSVGTLLGYHDNRLEMVSFGLMPAADRPEGWPTYEESMEEVRILRKAMVEQLGAVLDERGVAQFNWGSAYCYYGQKDQATSAGLNYTFFPR